jgi:hypothetical protein
MVLRFPTSGGLLYRRQLSQVHRFCFGGLCNEATAPLTDHQVDIFDQLLRKDYMSVSRLSSEGLSVPILGTLQGL